jgi:hypothetical protein
MATDKQSTRADVWWLCHTYRFVRTPTKDVITRLANEGGELKGDVSNLEKKLHYFEQTEKNSKAAFERLFQSGGSQS